MTRAPSPKKKSKAKGKSSAAPVEAGSAGGASTGSSAEVDPGRRRWSTIFGWIAGGSLGLLVNYAVFLFYGAGYPVTPTTFAALALGAFGGMYLSDRLEGRGFRALGIAAGILLTLLLTLVAAVLLSTGDR